MKLCKDCKYFKPEPLGPKWGSPICKHEKSESIVDFCYGYKAYKKCSDMRERDTCGYDAKLFVQKKSWF